LRSYDPATFRYFRKELSPRGAVRFKPILDDQRLNHLYHVRQSQIISGGGRGLGRVGGEAGAQEGAQGAAPQGLGWLAAAVCVHQHSAGLHAASPGPPPPGLPTDPPTHQAHTQLTAHTAATTAAMLDEERENVQRRGLTAREDAALLRRVAARANCAPAEVRTTIQSFM
jgi:hypothetical protein